MIVVIICLAIATILAIIAAGAWVDSGRWQIGWLALAFLAFALFWDRAGGLI